MLSMLLGVIIGSIYFILLDELIMGCAQRRIGPLNLGWYGFLSSLINGCNLIISQFLVTKLHIHFGFQSFPIFFLLWSLANYIMLSPFFLVDVYLSLILLILLSGLSIVFIILSAEWIFTNPVAHIVKVDIINEHTITLHFDRYIYSRNYFGPYYNLDRYVLRFNEMIESCRIRVKCIVHLIFLAFSLVGIFMYILFLLL